MTAARIEQGGSHVALLSHWSDLSQESLVARLVTGVRLGQRVRSRDGDRLNLCRANLKVEDRGRTPAVLRGATTIGEEASAWRGPNESSSARRIPVVPLTVRLSEWRLGGDKISSAYVG